MSNCWNSPDTFRGLSLKTEFTMKRTLLVFATFALALATPSSQTSASFPSAAGTIQPARSAEFVEDLRGVRTGRVNHAQRLLNTAAINKALAMGAELHLRPHSRIEIASSLVLPSGSALIGSGSGADRPIIFMPASEFDNSENGGGRRYGPDAVGINFSGSTGSTPDARSAGVRLENFILESDPRMGRYLRGIVGLNVRDCAIRNVEIRGIPTGVGIALASAKHCTLSNLYVHDFADQTNWSTLPQITAIEIDNDLVHGIASSGIVIDGFDIEHMRVSGPLLAHWGYQTDGINIANFASRVDISNGKIVDTGEAIDTFGSRGTIRNVDIADSYQFGLKFIHGASGNRVSDVRIVNSGLAAVTFSGSLSPQHDTAGNILSNIRIIGIDPAGIFKDHSTAGILINHPPSMPGKPRNNRVEATIIDLGPNGQYGWLDTSTGSGNVGLDLTILGGAHEVKPVWIAHSGGKVSLSTHN